jgi:iron complex outermembrane receptor protein
LIVGAYYLDLKQETAAQIYTATFIVTRQTAELDTESIAGFGQATFKLTDTLRLVAGARYTVEDRSINANDISNSVLFDSEVTFRRFTWRGGVEHDISPDSMAYLMASKGFKSGGFNVFAPTPTVTNAYDPETLYSYALGVRNRFLNNRFQLNIEGFYWDYRDAQQNNLGFTPAGYLQFSTFNAASASIYGMDVDLVVLPTPADTFAATLAFLDTKFDEFVLSAPFPTNPASNGCLLNNAAPPFSIDCSRRPLPRSPRWSGTASYEHRFNLANGHDLSVVSNMDFATERLLGINYVPNERAGGYVRFNAEATYRLADNYGISVFIRNIANKEIPIAGNQAGLTPGLIYAQVAPPRTYGIRIEATL